MRIYLDVLDYLNEMKAVCLFGLQLEITCVPFHANNRPQFCTCVRPVLSHALFPDVFVGVCAYGNLDSTNLNKIPYAYRDIVKLQLRSNLITCCLFIVVFSKCY